MTDVRVNLINNVDSKKIRVENIDGEPHLIIPSYTLPSNVQMNGGLYSREEIDKAWHTLEGTPAPLGHPTNANGEWVSAMSRESIHKFYAGAYNRNVRREGDRIYAEKVVNIDYAQRVEPGQRLLAALNYDAATGTAKGPDKPIHTSTGLLLVQEPAPAGAPYKWVARNMRLDHDAILLDEPGAATPEQGVGMMVNTDQAVSADALEDWITANTPTEPDARTTWVKKIANLLGLAVSSKTPITNQPGEEESMPLSEDDLKAIGGLISNQLTPITEQLTKHGEELSSLKTNSEQLAQSVKAEGEKRVQADKALVAEKHGEAVANALSVDKLTEIANALRAGNGSEPLPTGTPVGQNNNDGDWGQVPGAKGGA